MDNAPAVPFPIRLLLNKLPVPVPFQRIVETVSFCLRLSSSVHPVMLMSSESDTYIALG